MSILSIPARETSQVILIMIWTFSRKNFSKSQGSLTPLTLTTNDGSSLSMVSTKKNISDGCEEGPGVCALVLTIVSLVLILASLPLSLFCVVKVVQVTKILHLNTFITQYLKRNIYNSVSYITEYLRRYIFTSIYS